MEECAPQLTMTGERCVLPDLDHVTGHLPAGRYGSDLYEERERFVDAPIFTASSSRPFIWDGFLGYLNAWAQAGAEVGEQVVPAWWLAGSFISGALEPSDINVTPVLDQDVIDGLIGKAGHGKVEKLTKHRDSVRATFRVEAYPLRWSAQPCTLRPDRLSETAQHTVSVRGGLDAWWQRRRPVGPKGPPGLPERFAERG